MIDFAMKKFIIWDPKNESSTINSIITAIRTIKKQIQQNQLDILKSQLINCSIKNRLLIL